MEFFKVYDPKKIEDRVYQLWEQEDCFEPSEGEAEPYCIIMPPPNITGKLHMGHAIFVAIQDLFTRYARERGRSVLWLPGTDHASIATQNVVEKQIAKEGLTRHQLGREQFLARVWDWVDEYGQIITTQIRKLGASCDWSRNRFTMDERANRAVLRAFKELYERDLIYKGKYLVNWCSRCQTVLANDEVEYEEEETKLYFVRYYLAGEQGKANGSYLVVATVRPETLLGDVAVAVHPSDPRYKSYIGKEVILPVAERPIPVIADKKVDMEFGTGALKITPAHDFNDYEIAREHGLPLVNILEDDGTMRSDMFGFDGLNVPEARKKMVKTLKQAGLLEKEVAYTHNLGHCYRCKTVIEPYISMQWFVRTQSMAAKVRKAVDERRIEFLPDRFTKVFNHWIDNFHDWCISRQLWWGHRIPAWYCLDCQAKEDKKDKAEQDYHNYTIVSEEVPASCPHCSGTRLEQDPDVLDTWFSSGLWPFSTLGWPEDSADLKKFYPTTMMETGYDILFFWVARMAILGLELMDDVPFRKVYLHGLVRDAEGRKMSKSLGNVMDPLDIVEEYGADALRLSFLMNVTPGNDLKFSPDKVIGNRNFCNKLWNASRFVFVKIMENEEDYRDEVASDSWSPADFWIMSRAQQTVKQATKYLNKYMFSEAGKLIYEFVWSDYCDWYLEMVKVSMQDEHSARAKAALQVAARVLAIILKLLHPYIPFISEEIWQRLKALTGEAVFPGLLIRASWPEVEKQMLLPKLEKQMAAWQDIAGAIRNTRHELGLEQKIETKVAILIEPGSELAGFLGDMAGYLETLTPLSELSIISSKEQADLGSNTIEIASGEVVIFLQFGKIVDARKRLINLQHELTHLDQLITKGEELLANKKFLGKAPEHIISQEKQKLKDLKLKRTTLEKQVTYYEKAGN